MSSPIVASKKEALSLRAVLIGLIGAAFFCAVTPYNDFKIAATYISGTQFPIGAVFVLLVFTGINAILYRWAPRRVFRSGELLTIWTLMLVASGLPSSGMMRYFLPPIAYARYASTDANHWEQNVWGDMPNWLKLQDKDAADAFFKGYPQGQEHIPWAAWGRPLFFWGILAVLFLIASFSIASLLRRQWIEKEKFAFPLVTLPLLLAEDPEPGHSVNRLLRTPLLWTGFVLVTILHTIKGMHQMYPAIPNITTEWDLMPFLRNRPWSDIGPIDARIYPIVIGISYLLSAEVCFSLWFFHLFYKAEILFGSTQNWNMAGPVGGYTYREFHGLEAFGGGLALLLWTLYTSRGHLSDVWEKATGGPRAASIDDSEEMMSYRGTALGLLIGYGGIALWLWAAHVPPIMILLSLLIMTLAFVVISWVVCQAGLLFMAQPYASTDILATTAGSAPFPLAPWYVTARFESAFLYDTREMLAPSILEGAKVAEVANVDVRALFKAMCLSVGIGTIISGIASLALPYYNGGGNSLNNPFMYDSAPGKPMKFLAGAASVPFHGSWINTVHILGGLVGVLALLILRAQSNFGLHPIGFLCASVYSMHMLWFSIFLGWVCKSLIQRYGGMKGYTAFLPLFLGLILGDVVNACIWIVLGNLTKVGYQLMPG